MQVDEDTRAPWYRIEARADDPTVADIYLYDEIGTWGVSASDFAKELRDVKAEALTVHINSPGGEVFDGIAIYNALMAHPAEVKVTVDGLAASIASVIAMAGDHIAIEANAQMMIHEASGVVFGNAAEMQKMIDMLDRASNIIADVYAVRAGGDTEEWRTRMRAETWFTAQEAQAVGLVDEVLKATVKAKPRAAWVSPILDLVTQRPLPAPPLDILDRFEAALPTRATDVDVPPTPDESDFDTLPVLDLGEFRNALTAGLTDEVIPFDAELFRNVIRDAGRNVADPTPIATSVPPEPVEDVPPIDLAQVRAALRSART